MSASPSPSDGKNSFDLRTDSGTRTPGYLRWRLIDLAEILSAEIAMLRADDATPAPRRAIDARHRRRRQD